MDADSPSSEEKSTFVSGTKCQQLHKSRTRRDPLWEEKGEVLGHCSAAGRSLRHMCSPAPGR